jgi:hypothetical protein
MSKSIEDLREALFATLQGVKDGSIDIDKARAVNELGRTICDTAKVEVDYLKASGGSESAFLTTPAAITHDERPSALGRIVHHIKG